MTPQVRGDFALRLWAELRQHKLGVFLRADAVVGHQKPERFRFNLEAFDVISDAMRA